MARGRLLVIGLLAGLAIWVFIYRAGPKMPDFDVYWKIAARASNAEPLYRTDDGHFQFKYLPAFAVLVIPVGLLPLATAKLLWFATSIGLLIGTAAPRGAASARAAAPRALALRHPDRRVREVLRPRARARPGQPALRRDRDRSPARDETRPRAGRRRTRCARDRDQAVRGPVPAVAGGAAAAGVIPRRRRRAGARAGAADAALRRRRQPAAAPRMVADRHRNHGAEPPRPRQRVAGGDVLPLGRPRRSVDASGLRRRRRAARDVPGSCFSAAAACDSRRGSKADCS